MEILVTVVLPVVLIWVVAGFLFRKMGGSGGLFFGQNHFRQRRSRLLSAG